PRSTVKATRSSRTRPSPPGRCAGRSRASSRTRGRSLLTSGNPLASHTAVLEDRLMEVVVQWVRTSWTKRSRGEPEATRRNAAPTAFRLPPRQPPFVHQIVMDERDGFQPHSTIQVGLPDTNADSNVVLREDNGLLRVQLTVTPYGTPRRWR